MAHLPVLLDSYDKQMCITLWMLPPIQIRSVSAGYADLRVAACVDPQEESVYTVDTLKENLYGSSHP